LALIECNSLTVSYENRTVLDNLSFSVEKGDYLSVIGENGSGKTTLLSVLLGLKKPQKGEILFGDGLRPDRIGYLPQQKAVQKDFPASVYEVVLSGCLNKRGLRPFYSGEEKKKALAVMEQLGITNLKDSCYRQLSGGQQQRTLLARALCAASELLILDEPTTGLDPVATAELYRLIDEVNQKGTAIVMVTHDIREAVGHSKHVLHLHRDSIFFGNTCCYLECEDCRRLLAEEDENRQGKEGQA